MEQEPYIDIAKREQDFAMAIRCVEIIVEAAKSGGACTNEDARIYFRDAYRHVATIAGIYPHASTSTV